MPDPFKIAVLGDSVAWGQGLLEQHKFAYQVAARFGLSPDVQVSMQAHSGATIIAPVQKGPVGVDGEIPEALPTITTQVDQVANPAAIDLVLVNGGINDVDIRTILSPLTRKDELRSDTIGACYQSMKVLLQKAAAVFVKPTCRFVVTGYYPILSSDSDLTKTAAIDPLRRLLEHQAVAIPERFDSGPVGDYIISLCEQFWHDSDQALKQAVAETAAGLGLGRRLLFVPSTFYERNALFTTTPWLFGFGPLLEPEDEVILLRATACALQYPNPFEVVQREACGYASVGHPNLLGATAIGQAVIAALG